MTSAVSESRRQIVHMLVGGFALLLRFLTWWQAAFCALGAAGFNAWVLPRLNPRLFRPGDLEARWRSGIVIYPLSVLGLILLFPARPEVAAVAWVILAIGDGSATLAGLHLPRRPLPWNPQKTWSGLSAFVILGGAAGMAVAAWTTGRAPSASNWVLWAPLAAALFAGLSESAPLGIDDNITVPAVAALVLWSLSLTDSTMFEGSRELIASRLPAAVAVNLIVSAAGWRAGTVTAPGAVVGALIGLAVWIGAGWNGWVLLLLAFVASAAATRAGLDRKMNAGVAEARGGRRGPGNAIANTGLAAWAAALSLGLPAAHVGFAHLAMVAALVTASSDTVASEIGKAWGRRTWLVTSLRPVPRGTSGAVSVEGTAAGVVAALLLAAAASALALIPALWIPAVAVAATMAALLEGALGATFEHRGLLNNDALNLINAALGAALAMAIVGLA